MGRPVLKYKVPQEKGFYIKYRFFRNRNSGSIVFRTVKKIFYRDGEIVKSAKDVNLLETFLVLDVKDQYAALNAKLEFLPLPKREPSLQNYKLKFLLYESLRISEFSFKGSPLKEKV